LNTKRSPLREKPLRVPGQSLDEAIQRLREDALLNYLFYAAAFVAFAFAEWVRWLTSAPYQPVLITVAALIVLAYCTFRVRQIFQTIRFLKQGRDGERIVAEILDDLRRRGYATLHDIVAGDFNIDHVVISPHGIYAVETKTLSKPPQGEISFQGNDLIAGNNYLGNEPIRQAEAEAKWLQALLMESTGKKLPVKPVLVFPGWYVQPMPQAIKNEVWVLNPKALVAFMENEPSTLSASDMHMAAFHLARYVRAFDPKPA